VDAPEPGSEVDERGDRSIPTFVAHPGFAWALAAALVLGVSVLALVAIPQDGRPLAIDTAWLRRMVDLRDPPTTAMADVMNVLGRAPASWLIRGAVTLWLLVGRRRWAALAFVLTWLGAALTSSGVKALVDRPRPPASLASVHVGSASFPSGHVLGTASTTLVLVLVLVAPGRRSWWLVAVAAGTLAMAWSRTSLGVHWLTDTIAGALLGWAVALVATLLTQALRARRPSEHPARRSVAPLP
jgi:membrane-associated phospholipid phosphatase